MAITTLQDFQDNYLVKNGMLGNQENLNKAPEQLKLEINELATTISEFGGSSSILNTDSGINGGKALSVNNDTITLYKGDGTSESVTVLDSFLDKETVQDYIGEMVSSNTEFGLAVTYNDATNKIDFNVNDFTVMMDPNNSDVTGEFTVNNLGNVSNVILTVKDDSHNHIISNIDGLQSALDLKVANNSSQVLRATDALELLSDGNTIRLHKGNGTFEDVTIIDDNTIYNYWTMEDGDGTQYTVTNQDILKIASGSGIISNFTADDVLTISHGDTSTQASVVNSNNTVIQSITLDGNGHITGITSKNISGYSQWYAKDSDGTTYGLTDGDTLIFNEGTGIDVNFTGDDVLTITNTAPNITTNLSTSYATTNVTINSSDGTNAVINGASPSSAGVMSSADKSKLDTIRTVTGGGTNKTFLEFDNVISSNYTITTGKNALTAGDITINTGVTVTVPTGSRWVIV